MKICVIGGGGFVGSALVPELLKTGNEVVVMDKFYYGNYIQTHKNLKMIKGDVRTRADVHWVTQDMDAVIHLACISNDPSFNLNPKLAKGINLDCFHHTISAIRKNKPMKFIYASSSSVYGVSAMDKVDESAPCRPLTDYSRFKLKCEEMIREANFKDTAWTILRPATICGYAPRLRLDVIINALSASALAKGIITVHGGEQIRPNLNIHDMVKAYTTVLKASQGRVNGKTYNVGDQNKTVNELAFMVQDITGAKINREPVKDIRSYRVDSGLIKKDLDFSPTFGLKSAIYSLKDAYLAGLIGDIEASKYHNLKTIREGISEGTI